MPESQVPEEVVTPTELLYESQTFKHKMKTETFKDKAKPSSKLYLLYRFPFLLSKFERDFTLKINLFVHPHPSPTSKGQNGAGEEIKQKEMMKKMRAAIYCCQKPEVQTQPEWARLGSSVALAVLPSLY